MTEIDPDYTVIVVDVAETDSDLTEINADAVDVNAKYADDRQNSLLCVEELL